MLSRLVFSSVKEVGGPRWACPGVLHCGFSKYACSVPSGSVPRRRARLTHMQRPLWYRSKMAVHAPSLRGIGLPQTILCVPGPGANMCRACSPKALTLGLLRVRSRGMKKTP